jgi:TRAP-type C4-dicarboxylate transport system substrate-binding protein
MRIASGANSAGWACQEFLPTWAEKIKKESGGRIDYKVFCDGTLGKMGDTVNRVQDGIAEVGWDVPLAYGERFAPFGVVALPGLYSKDPGQAAGALWTIYENGVFPPVTGVKLAILQAFGNISVWTAKPVGDLTKLNGSKLAVGSKERAIIIEKMGGVPLNLRVPEYYQAIAKGAADGLFTGHSAVLDFSIQEVAKHVSEGAFGGGLVAIFMNQHWYDALPDDLKAVVDNNIGYEASKWASNAQYDDQTAKIEEITKTGAITVEQVSDEQLAAWRPAFDAAIGSWVGTVPEGQKYLDAFKAALEVEAGK